MPVEKTIYFLKNLQEDFEDIFMYDILSGRHNITFVITSAYASVGMAGVWILKTQNIVDVITTVQKYDDYWFGGESEGDAGMIIDIEVGVEI